jgi:hypothetical protein
MAKERYIKNFESLVSDKTFLKAGFPAKDSPI